MLVYLELNCLRLDVGAPNCCPQNLIHQNDGSDKAIRNNYKRTTTTEFVAIKETVATVTFLVLIITKKHDHIVTAVAIDATSRDNGGMT